MRSTTQSQHNPSRRSLLRAGALAGAAAGSSWLTGCGSSGGGRTTIRFLQNKPEVIGYFRGLVDDFNASQSKIRVVHDSTPTPLVPQFVRGTPPDLACYNYNLESSNFVAKGELADLGGLPEAGRIDDNVQDLVAQYAQYRSQTSVLPYAIAASGVIYNKDLFDEAGFAVPTTWSELLKACRAFRARDIVPIRQTYKETWTLSQGLFDYVSGSALDVADFYVRLKALGPDAGPRAKVSFSREFRDAAEKMIELLDHTNRDAPSQSYADGNAAFAKGRTAMYLQGPWAIGEIAKIDPKLRLGTFALPATEDPADTKVRVNLDLALWIPNASSKRDAAQVFLRHIMKPAVMDTYNAENLTWSSTKNAPAVSDQRVAGLQPHVDAARFYQGAGTYLPTAIPIGNYLQELVLSRDAGAFLTRLDNDWARYAQRNL